MKLGNVIKEYRAMHHMSMGDFSKVSGISKSYISLLEKDENPKTGESITPSVNIIAQAASAMQIDFNDLVLSLDISEPLKFDNVTYFENLAPTQDEIKLIENYRKLNKREKSIVDFILNGEEDHA